MNIEFLGASHAAQRVGESVKLLILKAQSEAFGRKFDSARSFMGRVCEDLRLKVSLPFEYDDREASFFADNSFAHLVKAWRGLLIDNGFPTNSVSSIAVTLAHRSQLLRAFDDPDDVIGWASEKVARIASTFPQTAADIECGRNPGDVVDPYILASTQYLLCGGDFEDAIAATASHKALMILEGLMGHLHEEVLGRMRGNVKNPEPRGENQELFDPELNPFPGADIIQPPLCDGEPLRLHQVKSKTGTMNSSGGARLAEQMRQLRMRYHGAEIYSNSLVGNTLRGHRSMGGMLRVEPRLIVLVGRASFSVLTRSRSGAELLLRLYQNAFQLAQERTGYSIGAMAAVISEAFRLRAEEAGEDFLELLLHQVTNGELEMQDSRVYQRRVK